jgi:hypothetical protein
MRLRNILFTLVILAGVGFAQDTNFSMGPQYLVTSTLETFLQPISTPSLSLNQAQLAANEITTTETPVVSETPTPFIPSSQTFFSNVFWGDHSASQIEDRRISTPSLSLSTAENASVAATEAETNSAAQPEQPAAQVIEITSASMPANLPASITDTGVTKITDPQSLIERGYGVSLGEFAAFLKSQKKSGSRVWTNEDLQRH